MRVQGGGGGEVRVQGGGGRGEVRVQGGGGGDKIGTMAEKRPDKSDVSNNMDKPIENQSAPKRTWGETAAAILFSIFLCAAAKGSTSLLYTFFSLSIS